MFSLEEGQGRVMVDRKGAFWGTAFMRYSEAPEALRDLPGPIVEVSKAPNGPTKCVLDKLQSSRITKNGDCWRLRSGHRELSMCQQCP